MTTRSTPARGLRAAGMLGALALLLATLAGCLKLDTDLTVDGDTVTGTVLTAMDKQAAAQLELDPTEVFSGETGALAELDGVSEQPYDDGTWAGSELTFDQVRIDELNQLSEGDPDGLRIIRDSAAGTYELRMVLDFSFLAELEQDQAAAAEQGVDLEALMDSFDVTVSVTFPDEVTEHNGDELSGTTVTWRAEPGERAELRAVAAGYTGEVADPAAPDPSVITPLPAGSPTAAAPGDPASAQRPAGDGSSPTWPLVAAGILVGLAAAAAAGWWFYLRPRRHREPAAPEPTASTGNPPADPDVG